MKATFSRQVKFSFRQMIVFVIVITMIKCEKEFPVANVIVSPKSATIEIGSSSQFEAASLDASGRILTDRPIIWYSSNASVATVSSTGLVTGISIGGPVTITAKSETKCSTAQVTVMAVPISSLTVSPASATIEIGETKQLSTTLIDSHNNIVTNRSISWSSSNEDVAIISSLGIVTGISKGGPVTITASCEGKSGTAQLIVIPVSVASVLITPSSAEVIVGENLQFSATVLDTRGISLSDRQIVWSSSNSNIATISSSGLATGLKPGGQITITATCEGKNGIAQLVINYPLGLAQMINGLNDVITSMIEYNQNLLERNPHLATAIEAKIKMLQSPGLSNEIIDGGFYASDVLISVDNRQIPINTVFPIENLRNGAKTALESVKSAFPILENFMQTPYPNEYYYSLWYGFNIGDFGGSGGMFVEEWESVLERDPNALWYDMVYFHELSHSFIGNETLNQFLGWYLYNMVHTNSKDISSWSIDPPYSSMNINNNGYNALLDIYQLIGHDNMSYAYKIIYPLHPPYGSPLPNECSQVFIDLAPAAVKDQVTAKVARINL